MSNSLTTIGNSAFAYDTQLTTIELPQSVDHIGEKAFFNIGASRLVIPRGVHFIAKDAFGANAKMQVVWPDDMPRPQSNGNMIFFDW
ncbi:MAG: leucine-rich repeat protein [Clostridia bacterium]|nr:leucine-rich repeat protein [Clostridia bacterium]